MKDTKRKYFSVQHVDKNRLCTQSLFKRFLSSLARRGVMYVTVCLHKLGSPACRVVKHYEAGQRANSGGPGGTHAGSSLHGRAINQRRGEMNGCLSRLDAPAGTAIT